MATKYSRLVNGGWECEAEGVRFTFFRPTRGVPFRGVDFKGDWFCKAYFDGDECVERATTREEGIRLLKETIADCRRERSIRLAAER
jgi:hypothetical protein